VSKGTLTYDDLLQIVQLLKSAESFAEFHVKSGDTEIDVRKASTDWIPAPLRQAAPASPGETRAVSSPAASAPTPSDAASPSAATAAAIAPRPDRAGFAPTAVIIKSPMVGTFYRGPEPGAKPFVDVGARVTPEMTVCIIEVMKLMNSIASGCSGVVTHVLADDAEPVDVGQILIVIDPEG
jgi:acetyl-CoA carboxylase biotin carboxyl carrier protein